MLDNAFGIFNNVSPRFQWAEIDLIFPSDDRFFAVANYDELMAQSLFPVSKMKIKDAFLVLFSPPEKATEGLAFLRNGNLTALDMQMLIHCTSAQLCSFLSFANNLKSSTRMSGHPLSQTLSFYYNLPISTPSFTLSKWLCIIGRSFGTKSKLRQGSMNGTSSASSEQPRLIIMLCWLLYMFSRRDRADSLLFRVIARRDLI
jgi:hypothetical protein